MALLPDIICLQLEQTAEQAGDYRSQSPTVAQQLPQLPKRRCSAESGGLMLHYLFHLDAFYEASERKIIPAK